MPSNSFYLLWMIFGYLIVTSVLVVSFGRLGDIYGRVRMYNLGFVIYTAASLLLAIDWLTGTAGADWLIAFRVVQGVGAAFLLANSAAILTDAFPADQRGMALGLNNVVAVAGMFVGLVLGGLLAPISWRLVFLISVPIGLFGTVWAYLKLEETGIHRKAPIDWLGNLTFAGGLVLIMIGVTHGIRPYGGHPMGWQNPQVIAELVGGIGLLVAFAVVESRIAHPMFKLSLFKVRAFTFGTLSSFMSAVARGGLMFILIIWLQGIWLPLHGYTFTSTPLWAGIYMLPLTVGIMVAGPISGFLSDRYGARPFATGGMLGSALSFVLLALLPINFPYPAFAAILFLMGASMGVFASPNRAGVMNSLPPADRGAGGGMNQTFQNSAQVLSIGIFFSLMIAGLASTLPTHMTAGPGRPRRSRRRRASRGQPAPDLDPVCRVSGLQPDPAPAGRTRPQPGVAGRRRDDLGSRILPQPDRSTVPDGASPGVWVRHRGVPDRRRRVLVQRPAIRRWRAASRADRGSAPASRRAGGSPRIPPGTVRRSTRSWRRPSRSRAWSRR